MCREGRPKGVGEVRFYTSSRIGLSIKAANYSEEELRRESEAFDSLRPGEDMVGLEKAFEAAAEDYRPGESKKK